MQVPGFRVVGVQGSKCFAGRPQDVRVWDGLGVRAKPKACN